ncbi:protein-disulfide reductase DsbD [Actinobacillus delphinicola]|uniref:Thiol:disulfide interchange protein DsbD n=1 Tax=Actinobacillus delphinicola TaxID=51161 RepID=A0A448TS49_9PAST|nr:protein-disulfide reductase DsbD [Actinobacillus delphinicola]MDG6896995.1 protein-disulfide reductase DsbD [Actinobacillus delphinicola]VEJ08812.1 thiol:disulfide interchange protein [Actinobacillus delphinicola]
MKRIRYLLLSLFLLAFSIISHASFFSEKSNFLPVNEAFQPTFIQEGSKITLHWKIAPGYWLYRHSINVKINNKVLPDLEIPAGMTHHDEYLGDTKIFENSLNITLPTQHLSDESILSVSYQGCTTGLCYPPETKDFTLSATGTTPSNVSAEPHNLSSATAIAHELFESKYAVFWFFILGLGLAFTPCVLPMLPLLSALVIGSQQRPSTWRAFALSFTYVQGMALTYTILGLIVAAVGLPFQIALQSPAVLITLSVIFVLLALSMFGLFTLQLPLSWQNKLMQISQKQHGGAFGGVFVMGMVAGLVASPCTSAPLSGALLYVAQSGNLGIGALTLYLLALGMGCPLILITLFGNKILPKSGAWLNIVKASFGFVMLALPIFLLSRLIDDAWSMRLWALLGTTFFLYLALEMKQIVLRIIAFTLAFICVQPLQNWVWHTNTEQQVAYQMNSSTELSWVKANTLSDIQQLLKNNPQKLAMIDFHADWCVACKELDEKTFSQPQVQDRLKQLLLIKVDMTNNTPENKAILEHFHILGLPAVLFFDHNAQEIKNLRLSGFVNAKDFMTLLNEAEKQNK